jgi:hypothetical protein
VTCASTHPTPAVGLLRASPRGFLFTAGLRRVPYPQAFPHRPGVAPVSRRTRRTSPGLAHQPRFPVDNSVRFEVEAGVIVLPKRQPQAFAKPKPLVLEISTRSDGGPPPGQPKVTIGVRRVEAMPPRRRGQAWTPSNAPPRTLCSVRRRCSSRLSSADKPHTTEPGTEPRRSFVGAPSLRNCRGLTIPGRSSELGIASSSRSRRLVRTA